MTKEKEIGELLKKIRLEKELDIAKIAENLRIRRQYLVSLEEGNLNEIPGRAYIKGYIKMYADYLGATSEIKRLEAETNVQRTKFPIAKKHINDNWVLASIFAVFILITMLLIYLRSDNKSSSKVMEHLTEENSILNIK